MGNFQNNNLSKNIKRFFSYIYLIIVIVLIILVLFLKVTHSESLFGYRIWSVMSESMTPSITRGSLVVSKKVSSDQLNIGDSITFSTSNGDTLTHRIVGINQGSDGGISFVTKGDANNTKDGEEISGSQIYGKYFFHLPYVGSFLQTVQTPAGKIALGLTVIQILTLAYFLKLIWTKEQIIYPLIIRGKYELMVINK